MQIWGEEVQDSVGIKMHARWRKTSFYIFLSDKHQYYISLSWLIFLFKNFMIFDTFVAAVIGGFKYIYILDTIMGIFDFKIGHIFLF